MLGGGEGVALVTVAKDNGVLLKLLSEMKLIEWNLELEVIACSHVIVMQCLCVVELRMKVQCTALRMHCVAMQCHCNAMPLYCHCTVVA